jgi:hypothetical protein
LPVLNSCKGVNNTGTWQEQHNTFISHVGTDRPPNNRTCPCACNHPTRDATSSPLITGSWKLALYWQRLRRLEGCGFQRCLTRCLTLTHQFSLAHWHAVCPGCVHNPQLKCVQAGCTITHTIHHPSTTNPACGEHACAHALPLPTPPTPPHPACPPTRCCQLAAQGLPSG